MLTLLTAATPNGWKVSIMIEEPRDRGIKLLPIRLVVSVVVGRIVCGVDRGCRDTLS
jgi:hypothetical protein